jgi:beta-galactosidase/beta-glucuronidase
MVWTLLAGFAMMDQGRPTDIEKFMTTRWSKDAVEGRAWKEYPRPQLVREQWLNLNGVWEYAIAPKDSEPFPGKQGEIRVPYPVQSYLSGVRKQVYADQSLWYRRTFTVPAGWSGQQVQLNFGAVDWQCWVYVNGKLAGEHSGGYDPFSIGIGDHLKSGENEIVLKVWDPTTEGDQPYGKQTFKPEGIWYTAVTGIWQTVWLEPVSRQAAIQSVRADTKIDGTIKVFAEAAGRTTSATLVARAMLNGAEVARGSAEVGNPIQFKISKPQLWSPDAPHLYDLEVSLMRGDSAVDTVKSYFGIREISLKKDRYGVRTYLNGQPIFMFGPLDQGWWPDGLYTPPSDDALRYDLEVTKRAGFNTVRKHVKVEPARFYRHCDEIGLLVWQDMPSNLKYGPGWNTNYRVKNEKPDGPRPPASKSRFHGEWHRIMEACRTFPSVVVWVPFNEAWGQFDTQRISEWTKAIDSTRLVNSASGGNFVQTGDIMDIHVYPGPGAPPREPNRAIVLGEFGGLGLPLEGHTWQAKDNWGYRTYASQEELLSRYEELIQNLALLKSQGLSAAIYTQTTDVEVEVNGLMTYDRAMVKMPLDRLREINRRVYGPAIAMQTILPTADEKPADWLYTFEQPTATWFAEGYDAAGWKSGKSGFGTAGTPGAVVGTTWNTSNIWLRRTFEVKDGSGDLWLKVHHDEDAVVYLNGREIARLEGYVGSYQFKNIPDGILRPGKNVLAISCKQTNGGQYVDAGFVRAVPER